MRLFALFFLFLAGPVLAVQTIEVAPRDSKGLIRALCDSREERTVIKLARQSRYELSIHDVWGWRRDSPHRPAEDKFIILPSCGDRTTWHLQISSDVTIKGNGSLLDFEGRHGLFVEEGAKLKLEDVELNNAKIFGPLYSFGELILQRVTIRGNSVTRRVDPEAAMAGFQFPVTAASIHNFGNLVARNVYIGWNSMTMPRADLDAPCAAGSTPGLYNAGFSRLNNLTFYLNRTSYDAPCAYSVYNDDENHPDARVEVSNTFFDWVDDACFGSITSMGFNLEPNYNTCGLEHAFGDQPFGYGSRVIEARNTGGVTYPLIRDTETDREAIMDRGSPHPRAQGGCEDDDVRGFLRRTTETGKCDIGAIEIGASGAAGDLAGTWLNPATDGHYLTVTQLKDQNVLVIWSSFDTRGEQLWLYGVGPRDGSQLSVEAYRNAGGIVAGGDLEPAEPELWGQLTFASDSCDTGMLVLEPVAPGPNISIEVTKIAESAELNCLGPE